MMRLSQFGEGMSPNGKAGGLFLPADPRSNAFPACAEVIAYQMRRLTLLPERLLAGARHFAQPLVRRGTFDIAVVPVPPLVGWRLRVACRRILPPLLAAERRDVEIVPGAAHLLVAAVVDEIGTEDAAIVAEELVGAVPLIDAEVSVELISDREPRNVPAHMFLESHDVGLRRARDEHQRGVARVQMREMRDLVGHHGAAATGVIGPAEHAGLEEGPVDDQLAAAVEQIGEAGYAC